MFVAQGSIHSLQLDEGSVQSLPSERPVLDSTKVELGRLLFWDPILSGDKDVACATCHLPERGYSDNLELSIGVGGIGQGAERQVGEIGFVERNAQSIINTAFNGIDQAGNFDPKTAPMFWDLRAKSLEEQALNPIKSHREMRGNAFAENAILPEVMSRLNNNESYLSLFKEAYDVDAITEGTLTNALSSFQQSIIAINSPFDRWMRGDANAMSNDQLVGMREFVNTGCAKCHSGPMFSDFQLHVLGVKENSKLETPDDGDGSFAFRTPSLRNLKFTAPYMHNGRFNTVRRTVAFYDDPGSENPNVSRNSLDPDFTSIGEIEGERLDRIVDFLDSLNDDQFDKDQPESVPSGLKPGGDI